jgi:hypothetical protein
MLDARLVLLALAAGLAADPGPHVATALPVGAPAPAPVGPPLLCFPLDIGGATSLPFAAEGFDVKTKMTLDQIATSLRSLLTGSDDVVFHMETLRRASIWLMSLEGEGRGVTDPQRVNAARLQTLLTDELLLAAAGGEAPGGAAAAAPRAEALRWFDLGYFLAAGGQARFCDSGRASVWLEKAARLAPDDPALQFGVALAEFDHKSDGSGSRWARLLARLFEEPTGAAANAPAGGANPATPAALRKNVLATFGAFLGQRDWEKLGAEVRKQSGRA